MAKSKDKSKNNQDSDGKGKGGCCGTFLGCSVIMLITTVILVIFVVIPLSKKYDDEISSNQFLSKIRTRIGDKIDEWNYKYVRGVRAKVNEVSEDTSEAYHETKSEVIKETKKAVKEAKKYSNDPKLIIDKANDLLPEPLIED